MKSHTDRSIRIRAVGPLQRDLLIGMYSCFEPLGAALGLPPSTKEMLRQWIEIALSHEMNVAAFDRTGAAVGHSFLVADKEGSAELAVFVHQEFRMRSVATTLVKAILEWGGLAGLQRVWTLTGSENTAALRLQRRLGFCVTNSDLYETQLEIHLPVASVRRGMPLPAFIA